MATGFKSGGRNAGTPNKVTAATRERIEGEADPIGFLVDIQNGDPVETGEDKQKVYPTLEQRISAATTLARKVAPDAKDRAINIELPKIKTSTDAVTAMGALVSELADGKITPSEAHAIAGVIETYRRTVETEELERRLAALEASSARN